MFRLGVVVIKGLIQGCNIKRFGVTNTAVNYSIIMLQVWGPFVIDKFPPGANFTNNFSIALQKIKLSDWMLQVTLLFLTSQSTLFQCNLDR